MIFIDWLTLERNLYEIPGVLAKRFKQQQTERHFPTKTAEISKKHGKPASGWVRHPPTSQPAGASL